MRYLRKFNESKESIDSICKRYKIDNYTINADGTIDVDGDVILRDLGLTELPLKFNNVTGSFYCFNNKLTSLEGCPRTVGNYFDCSRNKLTTLEGGPKNVGGYYDCSNNQLISLEGCPQSLNANFNCDYNKLTTLEGGPKNVIGGGYHCNNNQLTTLEGCPESIWGNFSVGRNVNLGDFNGFPEFFDGIFSCTGTKVEEIYDLFRINYNNNPKCIKWINEYDVIRGNKVILDRLEEVFYQLGMTPPENIKLKNYEVI